MPNIGSKPRGDVNPIAARVRLRPRDGSATRRMDALFRRLSMAIGLLCGLAATQAPEFAQQYRQRLAGAVDELSRIVNQFDAEAANPRQLIQ